MSVRRLPRSLHPPSRWYRSIVVLMETTIVTPEASVESYVTDQDIPFLLFSLVLKTCTTRSNDRREVTHRRFSLLFPPRFRRRLSPSSLFVTLRRHCEFHPGTELRQNFQRRSSFCNFRQSTSRFSSPRSLCLSPKIARACSSRYDNRNGKNCELGDVDNDILGG